jgi:putative aldouronate transport system substrate-binding protein
MRFMKVAAFLLLAACAAAWGAGSAEGGAAAKAGDALPIKMYIHYWNTDSGGIYKDDWAVWKEIQKQTNTVITNVAPAANTDSWEAYNLTIASGNMPDLMTYERGVLDWTASEGAFVPLSDNMDAMPNFKKALADHPRAEEFLVNADGKIYTTAKFYVQGGVPDYGWMLRQDWLDKLKLKSPRTYAEFLDVARAIRDRDPNGNGKADEIPIFGEESLHQIMEMMGASRGDTTKNGLPFWGPTDTAFRDAVKALAGLYAEKLIDPEVFTRKNPRDPLLQQNLGGIFFGVVPAMPRVESTVPGLDLTYILPPEYKGKRLNFRPPSIVGGIGTAVTAAAKDRDKLLSFLDWFYTEKGGLLMNWGIEGTHYTVVNGRKQVTDAVSKDPKLSPVSVMREAGAYIEWGYTADIEHYKQITVQALVDIANMSKGKIDWKPLFPNLPLTEDEQKDIKNIGADINSLSYEFFQKSVMGVVDPVASWDSFQAQLKNVGVETYNKNLKAAYERMKK